MTTRTGRTGRRPAGSGTRDAILAAARGAFAEQGYDGTSLRSVARAAGVDPSLVVHYFGGKEGLFTAALDLPVDFSALLPRVLDGPRDRVGDRLVRLLLSVWDVPASRQRMLALVRAAVSHEQAAATLREFLTEALLGRVAAALDRPQPAWRAALAGSQLGGLVLARYVLCIEPLASADADTVAAWVGPTLQRYLDADVVQA